jgi:hypothetical protein
VHLGVSAFSTITCAFYAFKCSIAGAGDPRGNGCFDVSLRVNGLAPFYFIWN